MSMATRSAVGGLGPQALPAIEAHIKEIPALLPIASRYRDSFETRIHQANWRGCGFRTWRLQRYLANNPRLSSDARKGDRG